MSATHPIIAATGSSGAGTTSVMRTFEQIFRRERVTAAFIEGDSFHRYDRATMKQKMADALSRGEHRYSHSPAGLQKPPARQAELFRALIGHLRNASFPTFLLGRLRRRNELFV